MNFIELLRFFCYLQGWQTNQRWWSILFAEHTERNSRYSQLREASQFIDQTGPSMKSLIHPRRTISREMLNMIHSHRIPMRHNRTIWFVEAVALHWLFIIIAHRMHREKFASSNETWMRKYRERITKSNHWSRFILVTFDRKTFVRCSLWFKHLSDCSRSSIKL